MYGSALVTRMRRGAAVGEEDAHDGTSDLLEGNRRVCPESGLDEHLQHDDLVLSQLVGVELVSEHRCDVHLRVLSLLVVEGLLSSSGPLPADRVWPAPYADRRLGLWAPVMSS